MKIKDTIIWILSFLPLIVTAIIIGLLPDNIPLQYDMERWGSKYNLFFVPGLMILFIILFYCYILYRRNKLKTVDNEKILVKTRVKEKNEYTLALLTLVVLNILCYANLYFIYTSVSGNIKNIDYLIFCLPNIMIGVILIIAGNMQPKMHETPVPIIKTKWSNASEEVWIKVNRFTGAAMIIAGLIIIIQTLIIKNLYSIFITLGIILIVSIIATIYSNKIYKKLQKEK